MTREEARNTLPFEKLNEIKVHEYSDDPEEFIMHLRYHEGKRRLAVGVDLEELVSEQREGYTRFVCISDTHGLHREMTESIPPGDVLLHCGDFTDLGKPEEVEDFNDWLSTLPHKHKIVIAGNHELSFDTRIMNDVREAARTNSYNRFKFLDKIPEEITSNWLQKLNNCIFINDTEVKVNGIRLYGCSWNPWFGGWAYNVKRGEELLEKWNKIPGDGIDILMTHSPPAGHRDKVGKNIYSPYAETVGCVELLNTVQLRVKPKYHIFGHIHESYGIDTDGNTTYINCSTINYYHKPCNKPVVIDYPNPSDAVQGIEIVQQNSSLVEKYPPSDAVQGIEIMQQQDSSLVEKHSPSDTVQGIEIMQQQDSSLVEKHPPSDTVQGIEVIQQKCSLEL